MTISIYLVMRFFLRILVLAILLVMFPYLAQADTGPDDLEQNRKLLEKWRSDPERYARLLRDLKAFRTLSEERQQQVRTLDRELHEVDSTDYVHLQRALERYVDWLKNLSEADRQRVILAANAPERLKVIREIRERQWIEQLPRATREKLQKLKPDPASYQA